ncbi:MAG: rod shape-determining protein RodA, partial [Planctomycetota bacterium]
ARWRHLLSLAALGLASAPLAWTFVLRDYQKRRVWAFLSASDHAQDASYQTLQSVIAIGSGGLLGRGFRQGTQGTLGFIPERHTDFIFAVVCEDFGLCGGVLLLGLYAALLCALARIARETRDPEGRLIVSGVATITVFQVVVNVGMTLGVMPVTGLTLPLVSYGGSSLVASMFGFGLAASVARNRVLVFSGRAVR